MPKPSTEGSTVDIIKLCAIVAAATLVTLYVVFGLWWGAWWAYPAAGITAIGGFVVGRSRGQAEGIAVMERHRKSMDGDN
jgi:uncharacterized membrane protein YdjX (TVP38/TMEM64 family)